MLFKRLKMCKMSSGFLLPLFFALHLSLPFYSSDFLFRFSVGSNPNICI